MHLSRKLDVIDVESRNLYYIFPITFVEESDSYKTIGISRYFLLLYDRVRKNCVFLNILNGPNFRAWAILIILSYQELVSHLVQIYLMLTETSTYSIWNLQHSLICMQFTFLANINSLILFLNYLQIFNSRLKDDSVRFWSFISRSETLHARIQAQLERAVVIRLIRFDFFKLSKQIWIDVWMSKAFPIKQMICGKDRPMKKLPK
jgi:hypothetical protein